jgi:23S rRNA (guanosine2251-2'-O)-methyltransferase
LILRDKNAVIEALTHGRKFNSITMYTSPDRDPRLREIADEAARLKIRMIVDAHYKDARGKNRSESVLECECEEYKYADFDELVSAAHANGKASQVVALDHVQDPRNLGAVLRSAAAAGADGVIIEHKRCCPVTAAAYETSSGGAEHVRVAQVSNLANALREMKENDFWVCGADERAEKSVWDMKLDMPTVWVLGAEGEGLHRLVRECCDFLVKIPTNKKFPSLNMSVAAGILLFEGVRQKKSKD